MKQEKAKIYLGKILEMHINPHSGNSMICLDHFGNIWVFDIRNREFYLIGRSANGKTFAEVEE